MSSHLGGDDPFDDASHTLGALSDTLGPASLESYASSTAEGTIDLFGTFDMANPMEGFAVPAQDSGAASADGLFTFEHGMGSESAALTDNSPMLPRPSTALPPPPVAPPGFSQQARAKPSFAAPPPPPPLQIPQRELRIGDGPTPIVDDARSRSHLPPPPPPLSADVILMQQMAPASDVSAGALPMLPTRSGQPDAADADADQNMDASHAELGILSNSYLTQEHLRQRSQSAPSYGLVGGQFQDYPVNDTMNRVYTMEDPQIGVFAQQQQQQQMAEQYMFMLQQQQQQFQQYMMPAQAQYQPQMQQPDYVYLQQQQQVMPMAEQFNPTMPLQPYPQALTPRSHRGSISSSQSAEALLQHGPQIAHHHPAPAQLLHHPHQMISSMSSPALMLSSGSAPSPSTPPRGGWSSMEELPLMLSPRSTTLSSPSGLAAAVSAVSFNSPISAVQLARRASLEKSTGDWLRSRANSAPTASMQAARNRFNRARTASSASLVTDPSPPPGGALDSPTSGMSSPGGHMFDDDDDDSASDSTPASPASPVSPGFLNGPHRRGSLGTGGVTGKKVFICDFDNCGRIFKRSEHLKRHLRTHTGEKPFVCKHPNCNKLFSRSDNLTQHLRIHQNSAEKNSRAQVAAMPLETSSFSQYAFHNVFPFAVAAVGGAGRSPGQSPTAGFPAQPPLRAVSFANNGHPVAGQEHAESMEGSAV